jgi:AraC-like DNA-binding protein
MKALRPIDRIAGSPLRSRTFLPREKSVLLHAMISSCGHGVETGADYLWDGLCRGRKSFVVFQLTLSGRGALEYEGRTFGMTKGDAFLVAIPHSHRYYLPRESKRWEFVYVVLYGSEIVRLCRNLIRRQGPCLRPARSSPVFDSLQAILSMQASAPPFVVSAQAYRLVMSLLAEAVLPPARVGEDSRRSVDDAKAYIGERLAGCIGVSEIARAAGLSRTYFSRLFREVEGVTPREYIEHLRMKKAVELLYQKRKAVKEIASECGYGDVNYFCRAFKRVTGLSPGMYRRIGI